jgi:hypothetical protein
MSKQSQMLDRNQFARGTIRVGRCVIGMIGVWLILTTFLILAGSAHAQVRGSRALRSVDIKPTATGWKLDLEFEFPIRYLSHSPQIPGRSLRIMVAPVQLGDGRMLEGLIRETLPIPKSEPNPLVEIAYSAPLRETAFVELQFGETLAFEVKQATGSRGLEILVNLPAAGPRAASPADTASDNRGSALLQRARHAIRDGELDLAIALLTRVLELPDAEISNQTRMDARELVGLTHERKGQMAHAQAEYEAYLKDYPDGPAAVRVQQRLDALLTASSAPSQALRPSSRPSLRQEVSEIDGELFGSVGVRYFRADSLLDDSGRDFLATNVLTDLDLAGRLDAGDWSLRSDFVGTYDTDVANEGRSNDLRISRLSVLLEDRIHGLSAMVGRQRRTDSGVFGRFDGLRVAADLGPRFTLSSLVGMPVESTTDSGPDTDTMVAAGALDFRDLGLEGFEGQFFAVGRRTASMTERAAIGSELRYSTNKSYSFVYLDYDVVFNSLNTFLASTTFRPTVDTDFRALIERRNNPILTLRSALLGQTVSDLDDLSDLISESDIRDLAEDRTAVSWTGTIGMTHHFDERVQLSGDFTVIHISDTSSSASVNGTEAVAGTNSVGPDFAGTIQLLTSDFLVENGVGSISLRYFEGANFRSFLTSTYSRFNVINSIRVIPRLRWEWRDSRLQGEESILLPTLEVDWRYKSLLLDVEFGLAWREPISGSTAFREFSYLAEVGARWEF